MKSIKKYIACAISAAMIMSSGFAQGAVVSYAEEQDDYLITEMGLEYEETDDGEIVILRNLELDTEEVDIPSEIDGKKVTSIAEGAFCADIDLSTGEIIPNAMISITIPNSVRSIGDNAFRDCINLSSIIIPESVTYIGEDVFLKCNSNLTITCYRDSTAYRYAVDNEIPFKLIESETVSVTGINLNATTKTLVNGKRATLKPTVTPSDATNTDVTWKSSNSKVATVSDEGVVKAVGKGTATITCTAADGSGVTASCKITVTQPVTGVKLNASSKTITNGKSVSLKYTISPANATNTDVTWKSSNTKVAKVDKKTGKVTAVGKGTAKITCTTSDGKKTATCSITVKQPVTKIKLNKTNATIKNGKTLTLKATVAPANANSKKVTWKSSNTKVATVSSSGKVTARKKGTATITCTAADGSGKKVTCKITVK